MITLLLFIAGLVGLVAGGEVLVRGASTMAKRFGVPPLIIGLTVVAYGTSAPELAVSVKATLMHQADLSLGNVIGSNIFNVLFILGASSLIAPLVVSRQLVKLDVPVMIGISVLVWILTIGDAFTRVDGFIFLALLILYTGVLFRVARRDQASQADDPEDGDRPPKSLKGLVRDVALCLVGFVLLVQGSHWLVEASITVARSLGVSELVIGLTIVAIGTSLPEVAASVVAAIRGQRDIAVGNVVGSNIFNLIGVLGAAASLAPEGVPVEHTAQTFDIPFMVLVAAICWPVFATGRRVTRLEGAVFLVMYFLYTTLMILRAGDHIPEHWPALALIFGGIPMTVVFIGVVVWVEGRRRRARRRARV